MPGRQRRKIIPALPDNPGTVRYRILALKGKANALAQTGDYRQAKQTLDAAMTLANRYNIKDARLAIMGCYKYLYTLKGDKEALAEIEPRLLALQDSVLSYQVMGTLSQMQSLNERRKMQKRLDVAELQRSATIYALIFMTLVVIAIILVAVIIYRKNRKLTQMGRMLYNRVQELTSNAKTSSQRSDKNKQSLSQKLTDDEIKQIYEKIKSAFRDTELVCSPDFTLTKLAQIVDVQPRIASQVLSSITGLNFCSNVGLLRK